MKGQKKLAQTNGAATNRVVALEKRCQALKKQRQTLRLENAQLRQERDDFRKAVMVLLVEPVDFDKKAILGQAGKQQPLEDLLLELEANASKH